MSSEFSGGKMRSLFRIFSVCFRDAVCLIDFVCDWNFYEVSSQRTFCFIDQFLAFTDHVLRHTFHVVDLSNHWPD